MIRALAELCCKPQALSVHSSLLEYPLDCQDVRAYESIEMSKFVEFGEEDLREFSASGASNGQYT